MDTFELAQKYFADHNYRIIEIDSASKVITFRFQMNTIHFWCTPNDDNFFCLALPNFTDVNEYNIEQVKEKCHKVNKDAKLVKLYILDEVIIASAEIFYLAEEDFNFQMNNALKQLIAAKTMYKKLDN